MVLLIVYGLIAIGISFICSVLEAVLLSISDSYIGVLRQTNAKAAGVLSKLKAKVDQPLAAILTLNTIAHTAGAAGVGAEATRVFGDTAIGIASAVMTLLILVLSEIIPKTLGANYWRSLAPLLSIVLPPLVWLLKPFVWMSDKITKMFSKQESDHDYLRSEIEALALIGRRSGALNSQESSLIQSLLQFKDTQIRAIMTPRKQVFRVHKDLSVSEYSNLYGGQSFSRVLVYDKDADDIIGYVLKTDILLAAHRLNPEFKISRLVKSLYVVSETMSLPTLFRNMLERRSHISLVIDEYGDVQGIITLEDMLESLLKVNIVDEQDRHDEKMSSELSQWQTLYDAHENSDQPRKDNE